MDLHELVASMPFAEALGIEITHADQERVEGTMAWAPERCTVAGAIHGGALMTFADSLGAVLAFLHLPEGAATSTIESKTNFLRGATAGVLSATTTPVHAGRRTIVVQTEVRDDRGKLVSLTTQTQAIIT